MYTAGNRDGWQTNHQQRQGDPHSVSIGQGESSILKSYSSVATVPTKPSLTPEQTQLNPGCFFWSLLSVYTGSAFRKFVHFGFTLGPPRVYFTSLN